LPSLSTDQIESADTANITKAEKTFFMSVLLVSRKDK
jgi:hypothetical protein